jgi:hypothetical protein
MGEYATFIVRLARVGADDVDGIVERVRTGEKARFRGLDELGPTIRRMLGSDVPDAGLCPEGSGSQGAPRRAPGGETTRPGGSQSQC